MVKIRPSDIYKEINRKGGETMASGVTGLYNNTMDEKGRVSIPAKYRDVLTSELKLSRGMDGCLALFTKEEWDKFEGELHKLPLLSADVRNLIRSFVSVADDVSFDKQGRIRISQGLRDMAQLKKDVVVTAGTISSVEIWDKSIYEEKIADVNIENIADKLSSQGYTLDIF